jgi:3-hydroxyisobutyrate dehydrogenase-like beta-hydroxyacid dehydrogenase
VLTGDYTPGFRVVLGEKDLRLGQELATSLGVPLQTLALSRQLFTAAIARGRGDLASGSIATVLEEIVGISLADLARDQGGDG